MRRHVTSLGLGCLMLFATPGAGVAGCAESAALLAKQVELIGEASALAADPNAPLGPGDTLITLENPALKSRTGTAFEGLAGDAQDGAGAADKFNLRLSRARVGLAQARDELNKGNLSGCEDAVSMGLAAAIGARAAFR